MCQESRAKQNIPHMIKPWNDVNPIENKKKYFYDFGQGLQYKMQSGLQ